MFSVACHHEIQPGFQSKVMKLAPQAKGIHCIIHRYALTSPCLSAGSASICNQNGKLCEDSSTKHSHVQSTMQMNADHKGLIFYTAVCWLSKGSVINCVFEMKDEIKLFLKIQEMK